MCFYPKVLIPAFQIGTYKALSPTEIASTSSLWSQDIHRLKPWHKTGKGNFWESSQSKGSQQVFVTGPCSSILDIGWKLIQKGYMENGDAAICTSQQEGRGQKGRSWISPPGNLYAVWRLDLPAKQWQNLVSLLTGYLLARSLREMGWHIQIKWPNDLLFEGKKTGGILVESRDNVFLAGVGINLISSPFPEEIKNEGSMPANHLYRYKEGEPPLSMWRLLLNRTKDILYKDILSGTPEDFVNVLQPYLAFLNKDVIVKRAGDEAFQAFLTGIDNNGGLRILTAEGEKTLMSAEIYPPEERM